MDAERETSLLSTFLNTKSQHSNPQIVGSRLANYLQMLSVTRSSVFLSVAIRSVKCVFCGGRANFGVGGGVTLQCCQGKVCGANCFRSFVLSATGNTLCNLETVQCPICHNHLGKSLCLSYFSEFSEWPIYTPSQPTQIQTNSRELASRVFTCSIHMDEVPRTERVRLACTHAVCRECVEGYIEAKLEEGKSDLKCPTNGCSADISESLVRRLTPKLFHLYEALTFEAGKSALTQAEEVQFICPTANCPYLAVVSVTLFDYTCVICSHRYCPQCLYEVHAGKTCAQYFAAETERKQVNSDAEKATFFTGKADRSMRQCPKCKVWIQRMAGCKYMTCQSPTCQGKTYFCITCGVVLKEKHGEHKCTVEGYDFY